MREFSLTSLRDAKRVIVRACGRLVLGHGADPEIWTSHVDQAPPANVALDLSCVDDIDARGLGVLAGFADRARQRGSLVSVVAASRAVQRLLELSRLDQVMPRTSEERAARAGCRSGRPPGPYNGGPARGEVAERLKAAVC